MMTAVSSDGLLFRQARGGEREQRGEEREQSNRVTGRSGRM